MPMRIATQALRALEPLTRVIIVPHQKPDGDALGSATALLLALERMGKECHIVCATEAAPNLHGIPAAYRLSADPSLFLSHAPEAIIVVDSVDLVYAGIDTHIRTIEKRPIIINIDHHATNTYFGEYNIVDTAASSTCEIVYHILRTARASIDPLIAQSLLTGIVTDTGNFTNGATTQKALRIASDLIRLGADLHAVITTFFRDSTVDTLRLWGRVFSRMQHHPEHHIVYTYITAADMTEFNVPEHKMEGIANFLNVLGEGHGALVLKEQTDGKIKGSFRTTHDHIDVARIAKALGGGGHKKAAGFTIEGTLETALAHIWNTMNTVPWNAKAGAEAS
jgi:bifunctional oligoribonuclease and PAP phosphatase NrnA